MLEYIFLPIIIIFSTYYPNLYYPNLTQIEVNQSKLTYFKFTTATTQTTQKLYDNSIRIYKTHNDCSSKK